MIRLPQRLALVALSIAGIVVCAYAVVLSTGCKHGTVESAFCGMAGDPAACAPAVCGPWGKVLGLPNGLYGLFLFLPTAALALVAAAYARAPLGRSALDLVLAAYTFMSAYAVVMAFVLFVVVRAVCPVCMAFYATALTGLVSAVWSSPEAAGTRLKRALGDLPLLVTDPALRVISALSLVLFVSTAGLYAAARGSTAPAPAPDDAPTEPRTLGPGERPEPVGPFAGGPGSGVDVFVYADYECPHCARMHAELIPIVARRSFARYFHRDYPLDSSCNPMITGKFHENACRAARFAFCADVQGRFWEYHDRVFEAQRDLSEATFERLARQTNLDWDKMLACVDSEPAKEWVAKQIAEGNRLGLQGTPAVVINDKFLPPGLPPAAIGELIDAAAQAAGIETGGGPPFDVRTPDAPPAPAAAAPAEAPAAPAAPAEAPIPAAPTAPTTP